LEKIFEPFFTTKKTGSGIGLPTVKEIIKNDFGGTIEVESKAGKTRFEIRFPIRKDRG
jgi:signal transduction histidine kinase